MSQSCLADLDRRLRMVEGELAIRNLAASFTDAVNEPDADAFRRVWAEDAVWEIGEPRGAKVEGLEAIMEMFARLLHPEQIASLHLPFPKVFERLAGIFEIMAALALVLGLYARIIAVALALFMAYITLLFLRFRSFGGPPDVKATLRNFGNAAAIGGGSISLRSAPARLRSSMCNRFASAMDGLVQSMAGGKPGRP